MPEERAPAQESRIEDRLDRLAEDVAELKGEVRQMSQRMGSVEESLRQVSASVERLQAAFQSNQRWIVGLILVSWMTLVGLILKGQ